MVPSAQNEAEWVIRTDGILAEAYAGKGEFDKAATHAKRALQACRTLQPPPGRDEKEFRQDMMNRARDYEALLAKLRK
jgi:hypothetical protein